MAQHRSNKRHRLGVCVCSELSQTASPPAVSPITLSAWERFPQFLICQRTPTCTHYVTLLWGPMVTCRPCWPNSLAAPANEDRMIREKRNRYIGISPRVVKELKIVMSNVNICLTLRSPANFKCVIQRVLHLKKHWARIVVNGTKIHWFVKGEWYLRSTTVNNDFTKSNKSIMWL